SVALGHLLAQRTSEVFHLLFEWLAVVLDGLRTHIPAGREDVTVLSDVIELRGNAEAGHVCVLARAFITAPGVVGAGDLCDICVAEFEVHAIYHRAELASVDEECCSTAVVKAAVLLVAGDEPEANGDLRRVEQLAR